MLEVPAMHLSSTFTNGPELIAALQINENLRKAERLHQVSGALRERHRLRLLFGQRLGAPAPRYEPRPVPDRAA